MAREVLARQKRAKSKKEIVEERTIESLFHFTRVENLSSILRKGFLGRIQLVKRGIPFVPIDNSRKDGCPEAVCLTISFPNYKLFYPKRKYYQDRYGVDHNKWVVLLLEARLLWELDCAFCKLNAARSSESSLPLEYRRKPEALESMFGDLGDLKRWQLGMHPKYPSSPQAEVLVFDEIPITYLREVHFYDRQGWEYWYNSDFIDTHASFFCSELYFKKRRNY